ncbi:hypothetical protein GT347_18850 [Xylophilus rhododendri]|uniref:Uncharacterized protein n=1 Tax=Xylophilus rhododendri TaxID=2697032 RepID=A0A857J815_9BURK|nr:hypothetical protein [Xylophilus rhododendri]QHI99857.1 hypothetical protein GT347_18850 [Xylophilus rhododendri]
MLSPRRTSPAEPVHRLSPVCPSSRSPIAHEPATDLSGGENPSHPLPLAELAQAGKRRRSAQDEAPFQVVPARQSKVRKPKPAIAIAQEPAAESRELACLGWPDLKNVEAVLQILETMRRAGVEARCVRWEEVLALLNERGMGMSWSELNRVLCMVMAGPAPVRNFPVAAGHAARVLLELLNWCRVWQSSFNWSELCLLMPQCSDSMVHKATREVLRAGWLERPAHNTYRCTSKFLTDPLPAPPGAESWWSRGLPAFGPRPPGSSCP